LKCTPLDIAKSFNQFFHVLSCLVVSAGRALGQGPPACLRGKDKRKPDNVLANVAHVARWVTRSWGG